MTDAQIDVFAEIAQAEFDALPEPFRSLAQSVEIRIAELPREDHLASVGLTHPFQLLGLFEGAGLAHAGWVQESGTFANRVWLFRQPILAFTAEGENTLREVIRHVLVHEIGHHFGLSDDDMYAIDDAPDEPAGGSVPAIPRRSIG